MRSLSPRHTVERIVTTKQPAPSSPADDSDDDRFVYRAEPEQPPSEAVITAIAMESNVDDLTTVADDLEPLYDAIDPNALDALFEGRDRASGTVHFDYAGRRVTVEPCGRIELAPTE